MCKHLLIRAIWGECPWFLFLIYSAFRMVQINTARDVYFHQFLCIYHSVEIGVNRIAFFSLFLVMTQWPWSPIVYCGTSILDWVHPSCLGPFTWVDSGDAGSLVRSSRVLQKNHLALYHSILGASPHWVQQIWDISPLPPGQAETLPQHTHPTQDPLSQILVTRTKSQRHSTSSLWLVNTQANIFLFYFLLVFFLLLWSSL